MRTYGRIPVFDSNHIPVIDPNTGVQALKWVEVDTTPDGYNDYVYLLTLIQVMLLNLGESPFYGNYGLPAKASIVQQLPPDFFMMRTQSQFAGYFANVAIARAPAPEGYPINTPTYQVAVTTQQGFKLNATVPLPT